MTEKERNQEQPQSERERIVSEVEARQEVEEFRDLAAQGHPGAIRALFEHEFPEIVGDEGLFDEMRREVNEKITAGESNVYGLYFEVGEKLRGPAPKTPDDVLSEDRTEAVRDIAKSRGQGV